MAIPGAIQDVIMARIDSLPEGPKEVLQIGAVIEREFSFDLMSRVTGLPSEQLLKDLSVLKESELLYEKGVYPHMRFIFKHALTREVVYESLLTQKKKRLHETIGRAMEDLHRDNLEKIYGVLAEHFSIAENFAKGADYARLAAKKAEKLVSFADAIVNARKRVICLERLPVTDEMKKKIIDARTVLGMYLSQMGYIVEAKEAIEPILEAVVKSNYRRRLSQIHTILGVYNYMVEENYPAALKHLEEALQISEEVEDIFSMVFVNHLMGLTLSWNCEFKKTFQQLEKALKINEAEKSLWGASIMKSNLSLYAYNCQGMLNSGHKISLEALQMAEECADILSKQIAYTSHGISCFYRGFLAEAEKYLLGGIDFSEKINLFSHAGLAHQWLGHTYCDRGEFIKSQEHYQKAISLREKSRLFPSSVKLNKIAMARAKVMSQDKKVDLECLFRYARENRIRLHEGIMARYIGEILLHLGSHHTGAVKDWIHEAITADERNGLLWDLGRDFALQAEYWKRTGDGSKSRQSLDHAKTIFQRCGAEGWKRFVEEGSAKI